MTRCAFLFPGQGAQYSGMGRELADTFPEAREVFDTADRALDGSISEICFGGSDEELALTANTQPAILTVSIAALRVTEARGIRAVAAAKGSETEDITAVILERDRHDDLIAEVRESGARIRLIPDGDVAGAISTAWPDSGADILFGIGGTPEGVIAAAALKCMGGELQGRLWPRDDEERDAAVALGYDLDRALSTDDLVAGDNCFFAATGITDGELLKGVHREPHLVTTQSLVMRSKSGTVRLLNARHRPEKLREQGVI